MTAIASEVDTQYNRGSETELAATRRLYCDVLRGRQVALAERRAAGATLYFMIGGLLVETGYKRHDETAPVVMRVDNPADVAARCWDAGYTVLAEDALTVLDPFGLRIEFLPACARD